MFEKKAAEYFLEESINPLVRYLDYKLVTLRGAAGGFVCQIENEGDSDKRRGVKRVHSSFPLAAVTSQISSGSSRRLVTANK